MHKTIHPFYYDSSAVSESVRAGEKRAESDFYLPGESELISLDIIRRIRPMQMTSNDVPFKRLVISEDHHDDIIVSLTEANEIEKELLKCSSLNSLAKEVNTLTIAIRDLWNLLRARLH